MKANLIKNYKILIFKRFYLILSADSSDLMLRIYRAESYVGLQEYKTAIEDLNFVISKMPSWPEVSWYKLIIFQYCVCKIISFQIAVALI